MPRVTNTFFPFDSNAFSVELYEDGNASDYSYVYAPGVKAGRGATESYGLKNCPKYGEHENYIEITGNPGTDMMKFRYIGIDFGITGDGKKWYFVTSKTLLNYPKDRGGGSLQDYAVGYNLKLDVWETYKDKIGNPNIFLAQVTTSDPGGWNDISMLEQDILPFSGANITGSNTAYSAWKNVIAWQAKAPGQQFNYVIDGMSTTLQFSEGTDYSQYKADLEALSQNAVPNPNVLATVVACNSYTVMDNFATTDGGTSSPEVLTLPNPKSPQVHNRLNYFPYVRAFIQTIDGQQIEIDYKKFFDNKLPASLVVNVTHSMLPSPNSLLRPQYQGNTDITDCILFSAYPTLDINCRNITPITTLVSDPVGAVTKALNNYISWQDSVLGGR